jgi:hypothetical protein
MTKMVPYPNRKDWKISGVGYHGFFVSITNEPHSRFGELIASALENVGRLGCWLGYRFMSFDAGVLVENGKVSQVSFGLANRWNRPQYAGYVGYIFSARSVHGFWEPGQTGGHVASEYDDSPQYHPAEYGNTLNVIYTYDAPHELTNRVFRLNLSCFWSLAGH